MGVIPEIYPHDYIPFMIKFVECDFDKRFYILINIFSHGVRNK